MPQFVLPSFLKYWPFLKIKKKGSHLNYALAMSWWGNVFQSRVVSPTLCFQLPFPPQLPVTIKPRPRPPMHTGSRSQCTTHQYNFEGRDFRAVLSAACVQSLMPCKRGVNYSPRSPLKPADRAHLLSLDPFFTFTAFLPSSPVKSYRVDGEQGKVWIIENSHINI